MPSIIPGYEYDIFISYRHKDNKGAQWVTEFVNAFKAELEATFKEDVSIYFDTNTHDGIQETHNVYESLTGKLKCLVFIPIVSQTYCDPGSFAWKHEFCVFNRLAKEDSLGRDIRLRNGNVASRILPVRIHELDASDVKILTDELGGPLRAVDFIYRESGVNRPLRSKEEHSHKNQHQTLYQNQINKVANATKEIIESIANPVASVTTPRRHSTEPVRVKRKLWMVLILLIALIGGGYFAYYYKTRESTDEPFDKSIAILPFVDMTPGGDMEYLGDGIAEEIINSLVSIKSLKVVGRTSSFQFKGEKSDLREVGEKLQVGIVLEGSVQKFEDHFRITAQLIRTKDNFHIWSERYDLQQTNIFKIQDNIAANIAEKLQLTLSDMERKRIVKKEINPEAYTLYLKGLYQYKLFKFNECIEYEQAALKLDSTYAPAFALIGLSKTWNINNSHSANDTAAVHDALKYSERSIAFDPDLADGYSAIALISWSIQNNFAKARLYFEKSIELNPSSSLILNRYGYFLVWMGAFEKATSLANAAMIVDPVDFNSYSVLHYIAINTQNFADAATYVKESIRIFGRSRMTLTMDMKVKYGVGNFKEVIKHYDSLRENGNDLEPSELSLLTRSYFKTKRYAERDKALEEMKKLVDVNRFSTCHYVALVYATQQEADSCFKYLGMSGARRENESKTLKIESAFKGLHKDPRYIKLYSELGFDKY